MRDCECLVITPGDDDRDVPWCLLTRQVFENREAAEAYIIREQEGCPGGRSKGAKVVECYFGSSLRRPGSKLSIVDELRIELRRLHSELEIMYERYVVDADLKEGDSDDS